MPPLPSVAQVAGWAGTCTFDAPGSYAFICQLHPLMTGTVAVAAPSPSLGPTTDPLYPVPTTPSASTETTIATTLADLGVAPAARGLRVAAIQRGTVVRGTIAVTTARSTLEARVRVQSAAITRAPRRGRVTIGRHVRRSVGGSARPVTFAVRLNAIARRALARRNTLTLTLEVSVKPASGAAYNARRTVLLRARARTGAAS